MVIAIRIIMNSHLKRSQFLSLDLKIRNLLDKTNYFDNELKSQFPGVHFNCVLLNIGKFLQP